MPRVFAFMASDTGRKRALETKFALIDVIIFQERINMAQGLNYYWSCLVLLEAETLSVLNKLKLECISDEQRRRFNCV